MITENQDFQNQRLKESIRKGIPPGRRVLEIGCKNGDLIGSIQPSYGVGLDISPYCIMQARELYPNVAFYCCNPWRLGKKIASDNYDYILLSSIPEDLGSFQVFFQELTSICSSKLRLVLNFGRHFPLNRQKEVEDILEKNAFEIIKRGNLIPFSQLRTPTVARFVRSVGFDSEGIRLSIIIPARDEGGNIPGLIEQMPNTGLDTEIIFVEGNSSDHTFEILQNEISQNPGKKCKLLHQPGKGKWDAVKFGLAIATGQIVAIFDSDLSVKPEALQKMINLLLKNQGEFIIGTRILKPYNPRSMNPIRYLGNRLMSTMIEWIIGQKLDDALCGVKAFWRKDYEMFSGNLDGVIRDDPFGDFLLLFGAARENLKILNFPVRYLPRTYGQSKTQTLSHGWILAKIIFEQILVSEFFLPPCRKTHWQQHNKKRN